MSRDNQPGGTAVTAKYVIRAETRDGSKTLGVVRNQSWEEGNVYDDDDLRARLAHVPERPDLEISWRAADSPHWLVVENHQDGPGLCHVWTCPNCTGRIASYSSDPQFVLDSLARNAPPGGHRHDDAQPTTT